MYLFVIGSIIICYFLFFRRNYFSKLGLPHVTPVPLLGNFWKIILRKASGVEVITEVYKCDLQAKYVGIFEFTVPVMMLRDLELIKEVTVKHFDHFVDHPAFMDPEREQLMANNLFSLQGEQWRKVRALLSPAFTSSKMKGMFKLMLECADNFAEYVVDQSLNGNIEFNSKDIFTRYTNDTIATCAFGVSVDSMKNPKNDFYVFGKKGTSFEGTKALKFFISRSFPWISRLFRVKVIERQVENFFYDLVRETIATRDEMKIYRPDMIQLMMETRNQEPGSNKPELSIESMTSQAFIFFFGGFDTTSTTMCFVAHEIAENPEVQKNLQEEIDQVLEKDGEVTYETINAMQYLDAVINETLRKYPVQGAVDRICTKTFQLPPSLPGLKPVVMKPGERLWIPTWAIHRDDQYFPNSDKFDPERFLRGTNFDHSAYMPFGIGPRMCIGNRFAILEMKVMFFKVLAKCSFKISDKMIVPIRLSKTSLNMMAEGGFWIEILPRVS